jgi:hypothetical protein
MSSFVQVRGAVTTTTKPSSTTTTPKPSTTTTTIKTTITTTTKLTSITFLLYYLYYFSTTINKIQT